MGLLFPVYPDVENENDTNGRWVIQYNQYTSGSISAYSQKASDEDGEWIMKPHFADWHPHGGVVAVCENATPVNPGDPEPWPPTGPSKPYDNSCKSGYACKVVAHGSRNAKLEGVEGLVAWESGVRIGDILRVSADYGYDCWKVVDILCAETEHYILNVSPNCVPGYPDDIGGPYVDEENVTPECESTTDHCKGVELHAKLSDGGVKIKNLDYDSEKTITGDDLSESGDEYGSQISASESHISVVASDHDLESLHPCELQFRWSEEINNAKYLQVRNLKTPTNEDQFGTRDMSEWSTVYGLIGENESSYFLGHPYWPDASVEESYGFDKSIEFEGLTFTLSNEQESNEGYLQLYVQIGEESNAEYTSEVSDPSAKMPLFIYFGDNENPPSMYNGISATWPAIKINVEDEVTPTPIEQQEPTPTPTPTPCENEEEINFGANVNDVEIGRRLGEMTESNRSASGETITTYIHETRIYSQEKHESLQQLSIIKQTIKLNLEHSASYHKTANSYTYLGFDEVKDDSNELLYYSYKFTFGLGASVDIMDSTHSAGGTNYLLSGQHPTKKQVYFYGCSNDPTPTPIPQQTPTPTPFDWQGKWPRVRRVKDGVIKVFNYAGGLDEYAIGDFVYSEWTGPDGDSNDCWEIIGREQDDDDILVDYYIGHKGGPNNTECIPPTPTPVEPTPTPVEPTPTPVQLTRGQYVCLRDWWSTQNDCTLSWNRDAILTLMGITDSTNYKWKIQYQFPNGEMINHQGWYDYSSVNVSNNTANWSHEPFTAILRICLLNGSDQTLDINGQPTTDANAVAWFESNIFEYDDNMNPTPNTCDEYCE